MLQISWRSAKGESILGGRKLGFPARQSVLPLTVCWRYRAAGDVCVDV